ncbi:MAG: PA14 domain-containing protein [Verrucomicrobiota bacterium]
MQAKSPYTRLALVLGVVVVVFPLLADSQSQAPSQVRTGPSNDSLIPPGEVGEAGFITLAPTKDKAWVSVAFSRSYVDPVLVFGVQSRNGIAPVVARARKITASGCEVRLLRPAKSKGRRAEETVSYMVMEAGRHVLLDGTVIDAGYRRVTDQWTQCSFVRPLPSGSRVITQVASSVNKQFIASRLKFSDRAGFVACIQGAEAVAGDSLQSERLNWIAISRSGTRTATTLIQGGILRAKENNLTTRIRFDDAYNDPPAFFAGIGTNDGKDPAIVRIRTVRKGDAWVSVQEDQSEDEETKHRKEKIHWLAVTPGIISTVQTDLDGDFIPDELEQLRFGSTDALPDVDSDADGLSNLEETKVGLHPNRFDPMPMAKAWTRWVEQKGPKDWDQLTFGQHVFSNPVVVATVQTANGESLAVPRIRFLNSLGFHLQLEECASDDGIRVRERVGVLAVEGGRHALPDGVIYEARKVKVSDAKWRTVRFSEPFAEPPVILTQVITENGKTPVFVRVRNASVDGFQMILREEEALADEVHGEERVAWIAVSPGSTNTFGGVLAAAHLGDKVDDVGSTLPLETLSAEVRQPRKRPIVLGQMQSNFGREPAGLELVLSQDSTTVDLTVREETSSDAETTHRGENVGVVIMPRGLLAYSPMVGDEEGDGIADSVERTSGLDPSKNGFASRREGYFGDADRDGLRNGVEARRGLPLDSRKGIIEWEIWHDVEGKAVKNLGNKPRFANKIRREVYHLDNLETPVNVDNHFGSRIRGRIIAPVDGLYTFLLTGDNETRLYLAGNGVPFNKRLIASVRQKAGDSDPNTWLDRPEHTSRPIRLEAGKRYYLEVIQKEDVGDDFLQVAWIKPGSSNIEIISSDHWMMYRHPPRDKDDDSLPDDWENRTGLDTENRRGEQKVTQAEYGDPDRDRLTNFEEWKYKTDPLSADTDGDGVDDGDEVKTLGTDPLLPLERRTQTGVFLTEASAGAVNTSEDVDWSRRGRDQLEVAAVRRGTLSYRFSTPRDGVWVYEIVGRVVPGNTPVSVSLSLDGQFLRKHSAHNSMQGNALLEGRTTFLPAGAHELVFNVENVSVTSSLEVVSVKIFEPGGEDFDANGIADWLDQELDERNRMRADSVSFTSPVCIEGNSDFLEQIAVEATLEGGPATIAVTPGFLRHWFANVPLMERGITQVVADFEGGLVQRSQEITWAATRLDEHEEMLVRVGDSLKLSPGRQQDAVTIRVRDLAARAQVARYSLSGARFVTHLFDAPGEYLVKAISSTGQPLASVTVAVVAPDFGPIRTMAVGALNSWDIPNVPWIVDVDPAHAMHYVDLADTSSPRSAWIDPGRIGEVRALARLYEKGPIAARGTVTGIDVATVDRTAHNFVIERFANGDQLVRSSIILSGELPEGWYVEVRIRASGFSFDDGNRIARL